MEIEEIGRCYGTMRGEIMGENRKIYAALLGAGTVGSGVYKLAGMQEEDICLIGEDFLDAFQTES